MKIDFGMFPKNFKPHSLKPRFNKYWYDELWTFTWWRFVLTLDFRKNWVKDMVEDRKTKEQSNERA